MRQFILLGTILIFLSCTTKKDGIKENKSNTDTAAVTQPNSTVTEPKKEIVKVDFPLDSLLKFDSEEELKKFISQTEGFQGTENSRPEEQTGKR